ncbi:metal-dependent hydrolase, partial [Tenacibaculum piscium]
IPDLDVLASFFTDKVTALYIHRGFTHSIVFSVLFAPIFAWIVTRYEKYKNFKNWTWLFFLAFVTHPILDAHTTWGTQLFWPFDIRLAFKTIFVIDPLYTIPFLVFLIFAMTQKRVHKKRAFYNKMGLIISSSYLVLTFLLKWLAFNQFEKALENQNIEYSEIDTRPSPLNTILWSANVQTEDAFLLANYSFFDTKPITFTKHLKNHHLLGNLSKNETVKRMISISEGWFTINKKNEELYYNDLRFGFLSIKPNAENFVFKYKITVDNSGNVTFTEEPKDKGDGKKLITDLWIRLKGN